MTRLITIGIALAVLGAACKKHEGDGGKSAGTGTGTAAPVQLTMAWKPPVVGEQAEEVGTMTMKLTVAPPGEPPAEGEIQEETIKQFEVLEVAGDAPRVIKVHYAVSRRRQTFAGDSAGGDTPLHGKTYVVTAGAGRDELTATAADGAEVGEEELRLLRDDWADALGRVPPMARIVTRRTWTAGEQVQLTGEDLATLSEGPMKANAASLTLREVVAGIATFDAALELELPRPGGTTRMPATLTAAIDVARTRPVAIVMNASFTDESGGATTTGTMVGRETTTWK